MAIFQLAVNNFFYIHDKFPINQYRLKKRNQFGIPLHLQNEMLGLSNKHLLNISKAEAEDIYFEHYWLANHYDEINSQQLSNKLFEIAVYITPKVANSLLQKAINEILADKFLVEDGIIALKSLAKLDFLLEMECEDILIKTINAFQRRSYHDFIIHRHIKADILQSCI